MAESITHFSRAAARFPDKPALICVPSGRSVTFGQLDALANQAAHAMRALGLRHGDGVAFCLPNGPEFVALMLGAQRSGLFYTMVPIKASDADMHFIASDAGVKLLIVPEGRSDPRPAAAQQPYRLLHSAGDGSGSWDALVATQPATLPADAAPGMEMTYSSGTTGRPKGIRSPFIVTTWGEQDPRNRDALTSLNVSSDSVYLSTSPLYHSAPHRYLNAFLSAAATTVVMERFDARLCLESIDRFGCTHSVLVPTMFHRMLQLDEATRRAFSGRTLTHAVHGAAPCPRHVKQAMIDWWGPKLFEYYSGTEGIGRTAISSQEWLLHPGSVGKPRGCTVHILDDAAHELPVGQIGTVYFESSTVFSYWQDPGKTRDITSPQGWRTFGDVGYVDADGYLYLTDRKGFMVISGGVNVYPLEVENTLLSHPDVMDAAVFGIPDDDLGERLMAVVQLKPAVAEDDAKARELQDFCKQAGGSIKTPKLIVFRQDFPREDNGKVQKHRLRNEYLQRMQDAAAGRTPGAAGAPQS